MSKVVEDRAIKLALLAVVEEVKEHIATKNAVMFCNSIKTSKELVMELKSIIKAATQEARLDSFR